jgi:hypothetical protein
MRRVENSAGFLLSLRPVAMTGIVTPLIVSVPLCRGSAAVLNLPGLPKPRHPPPRRARVRQNMSALIRDEYGSQALFLAVTAAVRGRVAKKNYTSRTTLQHLSQAGFLRFSLRTNRAARLCGKALRQDFDSSFESRACGWPKPSRRAEKIQNRRTAVEPVAQGFSGSCKIMRCKSLAHRLFFCATSHVTLSAKCAQNAANTESCLAKSARAEFFKRCVTLLQQRPARFPARAFMTTYAKIILQRAANYFASFAIRCESRETVRLALFL